MDCKKQSQILAMNGGDGDYSYAHNIRSTGNRLNRLSLPVIGDLVKVFPETVVRIADLGCASTESSFDTVEIIIDSLKDLYLKNGVQLSDVHVFFNDLPSNDFNYVFRKLPPFLQTQSQQHLPRCFSAGVPGSFYGRLFPSNSLHFAYSTIALHWRSQVPEAVKDQNSKTWNKGNICITTQAVGEAYLDQFNQDFSSFLSARGEEMVDGGRVYLFFPGRKPADIREQGLPLNMYPDALNDVFRALVAEGLIEEEKLDTFNLPLFAPSVEEAKTVVEREGSFRVERMELVEALTEYEIAEQNGRFENLLPGADLLRSAFEKFFEANIGAESSKLLFDRVVTKEGEELLKKKQRDANASPMFLRAILVKDSS